MLAADTNVLVRFLTRDDPVQSPKTLQFIRDNDVWVPVTVVLETEWVLRSAYRYTPDAFCDGVAALAALPRLELQHRREVDRALALHRDGVDFADALHLALGGAGSEFVTFDRGLLTAAKRLGLAVRAP
jgi:predicted nucleic-acid-binding protein